eukprot:TRINITY_DN5440_c0_g1_i1.p1 TRINITY_DN5440_c0_g1~~TRINITY_DN5440_c0_g1_i1.p1  ORF type:complete len:457 (-),score=150.33 TRINITY_DN5440_c0_g1_i1:25-1395(-)
MDRNDLMDTTEDVLKEDKDVKKEKDFTEIVEQELPVLKQLGLQKSKLGEAIEKMLVLEKRTRQAGDDISTAKVARAITTLCFELGEFKQLNESLVILSKRRGQFKRAISSIVNDSIGYLEKIDKEETRLALIDTLRDITEGKIFVENERARLTRVLATIKEKEGDLHKASKLLQEIQIETYNTMHKREKIDFILEQIRLCVATNDWVRARIIARKISAKALADETLEDLKQRYYHLMVKYYTHKKQWIEVCKSYLEIYNSKSIQVDQKLWEPILKNVVIYLLLSAYDNEQSDLSHRIKTYKNLEKLGKYGSLLNYFLTQELMQWPKVENQYKDLLNEHEEFSSMKGNLWSVFQRRVVEHNIRVLEKYYTRISLKRLSALLHLGIEEVEDYISELVVSKMIFAKIDRPKGIVSFRPIKEAGEILDTWSHSIGELLDIMEKTSHLVQRETMLHQISNK